MRMTVRRYRRRRTGSDSLGSTHSPFALPFFDRLEYLSQSINQTRKTDAPFIILDEPTASLDPVAEAEIYEKFAEIVGDRTAIYISHRLSSCKFCDKIAVFHHGTIVQTGTHQSLLTDQTGIYHTLWQAQAQYYT